ncbi:alpha-1,3-mannosyltransferase CMT1 [Glarea lozoyensis ATCC 20868]|uniref:Alpha-1,3-mannosyltransferase CMT1 n=1 Tax=Glarea lozoyensis (strain ATCC 20868 / MF5171) TaxID=1116229 RepID=S3D707_GLAL2|nr:alpha-1,3-mannosyltransferase CMT1 [Glarea lozoyensis ATCC 20868]EPE33585.1 alpha-1,3-mannosyltransferase CMT1 [Glarea lozoyensis ATCC 20868]
MLRFPGAGPLQFKRFLLTSSLITAAFFFWLRLNRYRETEVSVYDFANGFPQAPSIPHESRSSQLSHTIDAAATSVIAQSSHATGATLVSSPIATTQKNSTESRVENATLLALAPLYHKAIFDPGDESFPRLKCPSLTHSRYDYLQDKLGNVASGDQKYYFAINLHDSIQIIPRLLGSVVETMRFLGFDRCTLSIIEGRSVDGTYEVLKSLAPALGKLGVTYHFNSSDVNPEVGNRIGNLAALRNDALEPLRASPTYENASVIFLNDVAICMEDILELVHQRITLEADMVCGMDWKNLWKDPTFYDVWIARTMTGDSFFEVGEDGNWDSAWNLFWSDDKTQQRFQDHLPFQVFSCWNGGAVFGARPFFKTAIEFRAPREGECFNGEPAIFCKELWWLGYGKIAVIPTVNLEYSDEGAELVRELRGTPSTFTLEDGLSKIEWVKEPPEKVRCVTNYDQQTWGAWNESMPEPPAHS